MFDPRPIDDALSYTVPAGKTAELIYFRAGYLSEDLIYFSITANTTPIRYFPVGPKSDIHVTLAIAESHPGGARFDVCLAAPRGLVGTAVLDVGLVEIAAGG